MADPIPETTVVPISAAVAGALNDGLHTDDEAPSAREQDRREDGPATAPLASSRASRSETPISNPPP
jgi:hypothetical protein